MNILVRLPFDAARFSFVIPGHSGSVLRLLPRRGQDQVV